MGGWGDSFLSCPCFPEPLIKLIELIVVSFDFSDVDHYKITTQIHEGVSKGV